MNPNQSGKVWIRVLNSDPVIRHSAKHEIWTHTSLVRNADPGLDAGSVVQCRARFTYSHGTRAKADVRIRTLGSRSASHLFDCVWYHLKITKVLNVQIHMRNGAKLFNFIKNHS
jgi:hypothetical protein